MATQSFIQQSPDGSGKKVDTAITSTALQHRQVMVIGDPSIDGNYALVSAQGAQLAENRSATVPTYAASVSALVPAASATDIFTVSGSATKTIKIKRILVSGTKTTAGSVLFNFLKRSTANSGGTLTNPARVPHDSQNSSATATVNSYTANPTTLGTLIGNLYGKIMLMETATSSSDFQGTDLGINSEVQPIVLRGINEIFAVNLNGATVTGGSITISIIWTEE